MLTSICARAPGTKSILRLLNMMLFQWLYIETLWCCCCRCFVFLMDKWFTGSEIMPNGIAVAAAFIGTISMSFEQTCQPETVWHTCKIHILSFLFIRFVCCCAFHLFPWPAISTSSRIQIVARTASYIVVRISETKIHLRMRTFTRISTLRSYTIVQGNYTYM